MAINVIGFRWGDSDENHKYDYEALENKPSTDLGVLDIDTTAEQGTDDGDLYRAIHSFSWDSVINTLSGILNVKKLFTNIINQVKTNKDALDDPGQILKDGIGSLSTSSSVISSDRFIIKENDGSIKQVTPLSTLRGGVRNLTTVVSFLDRFIPTISTSDASEINKAPVSSVVRAGIYNLASGSASDLNEDLSDSIVVQTEAEAGALDPAYVEKHTLSEIHDLFGIDDLKTTVSGHTTRLSTAEDNITTLQNDKVDKTTPLLNFDDTATDPLTDDGALANALTALGILSDVIPSGGGSLYLKKALTELAEKLGKLNSISGTVPVAVKGIGGNLLYAKSGNVVTASIVLGNGTTFSGFDGQTDIGTLPVNLRPKLDSHLTGLARTSGVWGSATYYPCDVYISPSSGNIQLRGGAGIANCKYLTCSGCYII